MFIRNVYLLWNFEKPKNTGLIQDKHHLTNNKKPYNQLNKLLQTVEEVKTSFKISVRRAEKILESTVSHRIHTKCSKK